MVQLCGGMQIFVKTLTVRGARTCGGGRRGLSKPRAPSLHPVCASLLVRVLFIYLFIVCLFIVCLSVCVCVCVCARMCVVVCVFVCLCVWLACAIRCAFGDISLAYRCRDIGAFAHAWTRA